MGILPFQPQHTPCRRAPRGPWGPQGPLGWLLVEILTFEAKHTPSCRGPWGPWGPRAPRVVVGGNSVFRSKGLRQKKQNLFAFLLLISCGKSILFCFFHGKIFLLFALGKKAKYFAPAGATGGKFFASGAKKKAKYFAFLGAKPRSKNEKQNILQQKAKNSKNFDIFPAAGQNIFLFWFHFQNILKQKNLQKCKIF